jgi:hypothetical protein
VNKTEIGCVLDNLVIKDIGRGHCLAANDFVLMVSFVFNLLTPELNPYAQRCLTRLFTGDFASWTVHFVNICVKSQQIHKLFIQFINYVW